MAMTRRQARERVFELLYELEMKTMDAEDLLSSLPMPPEQWVAGYVRGVAAHRAELDAVISQHLREDWDLDRLALTDRLVLRAGIWELRNRDTPRGVVLSESVELAKRYGGEDSATFVNGLLAAVARAR